MLKVKKNVVDKTPIEDATPVITRSTKLLVTTTGTGASLGK